MKTKSFDVLEWLGNTSPFRRDEKIELVDALRALADNGTPLPKDMMRKELVADGQTRRDLPAAIDLAGESHDALVLALLKRFDGYVAEHLAQVPAIVAGAKYVTPEGSWQLRSLLRAMKPRSRAGALAASEYLGSNHEDSRRAAADMLEGIRYVPEVIDRLFVASALEKPVGAKALASFVAFGDVRRRLLARLRTGSYAGRHSALESFQHLGPQAGEEAEIILFEIAERDGDDLQAEALLALCEISERGDRLRKIALRLIHSDQVWIRNSAIRALKHFDDDASISALIGALMDEGAGDIENDADAAEVLLAKRIRDPQPLMGVLRQMTKSHDDSHAAHGGLVDAARRARREARAAGRDPDDVMSFDMSRLLVGVVRIFGRMGANAKPALPLLEELCERPYVADSNQEEVVLALVQSIRDA